MFALAMAHCASLQFMARTLSTWKKCIEGLLSQIIQAVLKKSIREEDVKLKFREVAKLNIPLSLCLITVN